MKRMNTIGLAALAAMALMASIGASGASATTLEEEGVTKNQTITITASLESGTSMVLKNTSGSIQNTCTGSHWHGYTTAWTGGAVTGPFTGHPGAEGSEGMSYTSCTRAVTVHDPGTFEIEHIPGTTNGTVNSETTIITVAVALVGYLTCETGETTHIGTLTGVKEGHATIHANGVIPCGITAKWEATYVVTHPTGLGVST